MGRGIWIVSPPGFPAASGNVGHRANETMRYTGIAQQTIDDSDDEEEE